MKQKTKRFKKMVIALLFTLPITLNAFGIDTNCFSTNTLVEDLDQKGHPNLQDENGRQGMWTIWGYMKPEKGYPKEGKVEEGNYKDGRKHGEWTKYHEDGETPRLRGAYVNNRPNGAYTKYYPNGVLMEEGKFTSGKLVEVFKRYYDTGVLEQEKHFNEGGQENGVNKFFHPNGQVEFEYTKKDGMATGEAKRYYSNGDVKEIMVFDNEGKVVSRVKKERVNPPYKDTSEAEIIVSNAPNGSLGKTNSKKFKKNGYNKVYNDYEELWMDGEFKNSKLWDGKLYKYDNDGILLKIEVWRKGKYHSEGQL